LHVKEPEIIEHGIWSPVIIRAVIGERDASLAAHIGIDHVKVHKSGRDSQWRVFKRDKTFRRNDATTED